jgi:Bacterial TSP3 repeat
MQTFFMQNRTPYMSRLVFTLLIAIFLTACGGGSSDFVAIQSDEVEQVDIPLSIQANAVKGPVVGAKIDLYKVDLKKGEIAAVNRAASLFFDILYDAGVRYDSGVLQFTDLNDAQALEALNASFKRLGYTGSIGWLKAQVEVESNIDDVIAILEAFVSAETNRRHSEAVDEILKSNAGLSDIKRRLADIPTYADEWKELEDSEKTFTSLEQLANEFYPYETSSEKLAGWSDYFSNLSTLKAQATSLSALQNQLDSIFDQGESENWFVRDLVARKNLLDLQDALDAAAGVQAAKSEIRMAYRAEGNESLAQALEGLYDSIIDAELAAESLLKADALVNWSLAPLLAQATSAQSVFDDFVNLVAQKLPTALQKAFINDEVDPRTNKPLNWLGARISDEQSFSDQVPLDDYHGFIYVDVDASEGVDLNSGTRSPLVRFQTLFHTDVIRGFGNNSKEDYSVRYMLEGELLRFDDGSLVYDLQDERLTDAQRTRYRVAEEVLPLRSATVLSSIGLTLGVEHLNKRDRWISESVLASSDGSGDYFFSEEALTQSLRTASETIVSSFSGISSSHSLSVFDAPYLMTKEALFDDQHPSEVVGMRFMNEYVASFLSGVAEQTGLSFDELVQLLAEDLLDKQVDGKSGSRSLAQVSSISAFGAMSRMSGDSYTIVGTNYPVASVFDVLIEEFSETFPGVDLSDLGVSKSDFSFSSPAGGVDSDGDGVLDNDDLYPEDPAKSNDIPADYAGIWSADFSSMVTQIVPFEGVAEFVVNVEAVKGSCSVSPCIGLGSLGSVVLDSWSVLSKPEGGDLLLTEPADPAHVGFMAAGTVPGVYEVHARLTTAALPSLSYEATVKVEVLSLRNYVFSVSPASPSPSDTVSAFIKTDTKLCSAYPVCGGIAVGDDINISLLGGDLYSSWFVNGQGLISVSTDDWQTKSTGYNDTLTLYIKQLGSLNKVKVFEFYPGLGDDSDGDGIIDQNDYFPQDANCSAAQDGVDIGAYYASRFDQNLTAFNPELLNEANREETLLSDSKVCFTSLFTDVNAPTVQFPNRDLSLFYDSNLSLVALYDPAGGAFTHSVFIESKSLVQYFVLSEDANRLFVIYESGKLDYLDLRTLSVESFVEELDGYEVAIIPTTIGSNLWVTYSYVGPGPAKDDIQKIYSASGDALEFTIADGYPAPSQQMISRLGSEMPKTLSDSFSVIWEIQRPVVDPGTGNVTFQVFSAPITSQLGQILRVGQTQLGDLVTARLRYIPTATDIFMVKVPVLGLSGFQFEEEFPLPQDDLVVLTSSSIQPISNVEDYITVVWFLNNENVDELFEFSRSESAPYVLSSESVEYGDIVEARIFYDLGGIELELDTLFTIVIGDPSSQVPVLTNPATVLGNIVTANLGTITANNEYLFDYFTPLWSINGEVLLDGFGNSLSARSFRGEVPFGGSLEVAYGFNYGGVTSISRSLAISGPEIVSSVIFGYDSSFSNVGDIIRLEESLFDKVSLEAEYRGLWFVNGNMDKSVEQFDYETSGLNLGDSIELVIEEIDSDPNDNIEPDRLDNTVYQILGYGFDSEGDQDSDGDGVRNSEDYFVFDPACSAIDQGNPDDNDGDGISNIDELNLGASNVYSFPNKSDSDGDGLIDLIERDSSLTDQLNMDSDGDGNDDYYEYRLRGTDPNSAGYNFQTADPVEDSDQDGLLDGEERIWGTKVSKKDTDEDGLEDGYEVNVLGTDPLVVDSDYDGLSDGLEVFELGTDPLNNDSDSDLISDGYEVANGYNPKSNDSFKNKVSDTIELATYIDTDGDGLSDEFEAANGLDPNDPDEDSDGFPDGIAHPDDIVGYAYNIRRGGLVDYQYFDRTTALPAGTCYASWLYSNTPTIIAASEAAQDLGTDQKLAMARAGRNEVFLFDASTQAYLNSVLVGLVSETVSAAAFADGASSIDTLFVGFSDGVVRRYDVSTATPSFTRFYGVSGQDSVSAIKDQGAFLIVELSIGAQSYQQRLYDKTTSALLHTIDTDVSIATSAWDSSSKNRLWVLGSDNPAIFSAFDYDSGTPTNSAQIAEANLNSDSLELLGPIFIDISLTERVLNFGSGHVYYLDEGVPYFEGLESARSIKYAFSTLANQFDDGGSPGVPGDDTETVHNLFLDRQNNLSLRLFIDPADAGSYWSYTKVLDNNAALGLIPVQEDVGVLQKVSGINAGGGNFAYLEFNRVQVGDSDEDELPGWYEEYSLLDDTDAADATAVANFIQGQTRVNVFNAYTQITGYLLDKDGDGISDQQEEDLFLSAIFAHRRDTDFDGLTDKQELDRSDLANFDPSKADSDGDGTLDGAEDLDGDGITNSDELNVYKTDIDSSDSDADGVSDSFELFVLGTDPLVAASRDFDLDGTPDHDGNSDYDDDGLSNSEEELNSTNPFVADSDADGLSDFDEVNTFAGADPNLADSDFDGIGDFAEVNSPNLDPADPSDAVLDLDGDGLSNAEEVIFGSDLTVTDSDGDGLTDFEEVRPTRVVGEVYYTTSPIIADTDGDGVLNDKQERDGTTVTLQINDGASVTEAIKTRGDIVDTDGDGLTDIIELDVAGLPRSFLSDPRLADSDGDGLSDNDEYLYEFIYTFQTITAYNFDPDNLPNVFALATQSDTDADGLSDLIEFGLRSNIGYEDTDNDYLSDSDEQDVGTSFLSQDSDGDQIGDGFEVHILETDPLDQDSDDNGVNDSLEDPDGDTLTNYEELYLTFTVPAEKGNPTPDTNDSGILTNDAGRVINVIDGKTYIWIYDAENIILNGRVDSNGDILDENNVVIFENNYTFIASGNGLKDGEEDPDNDGLSNSRELELGTSPWKQDTDGDGLDDGSEAAEDPNQPGSGISISNPLISDTDGDGLFDSDEIAAGTDPRKVDTDGDNLSDAIEIGNGLDPLNKDTDRDYLADDVDPFPLDIDGDGDGIFDVVERLILQTKPEHADTDTDGIPDNQEVWVFAYDPGGDLLTIGEDANNDGKGDVIFNSRNGNSSWVPFQYDSFSKLPFRDRKDDLIDTDGNLLGSVYLFYTSNPSKRDSDDDGLTDDTELLLIENAVAGGSLDLDQGIDLSANDPSDPSYWVYEAALTENRFKTSNPLKVFSTLVSDIDAVPTSVSDANQDYDSDYLVNLIEQSGAGTNVLVADSDFDNSDPGNVQSDGLLDGIEFLVLHTSPSLVDTDSDGLDDDQEVSSTFVSPGATLTSGTNPYKVVSAADCLPEETPLTNIAGQDYCVSVSYVSYPTLEDSDADLVVDGTDAYPLDSACSDVGDGFNDPNRAQCYASWMAQQNNTSQEVAFIDAATKTEVALLGDNWDSVIRYDYAASAFETHHDVAAQGFKFLAYENTSEMLYLISPDGQFRSIDTDNDSEQDLTALSLPVGGSVDAVLALDSHILAQIGEGLSAELRMYDLTGNLIDQSALPYVDLSGAVWVSGSQRVYAYLSASSGAADVFYLPFETQNVGSNGFAGGPVYSGKTWASLSGRLTLDSMGTFGDTTDDTVIVPSGYTITQDLATAVQLNSASYFGSDSEQTFAEVRASYWTLDGESERYFVGSYLDESELGVDGSDAEVNSITVRARVDRAGDELANSFNFVAQESEQGIWGLLTRDAIDREIFAIKKQPDRVLFEKIGVRDYDNDFIPCFYERLFDLVDDANCGVVKSFGGEGVFADPDGDQLVNIEEYEQLTNPRNDDSDGDGWDDAYEANRGTSPIDSSEF